MEELNLEQLQAKNAELAEQLKASEESVASLTKSNEESAELLNEIRETLSAEKEKSEALGLENEALKLKLSAGVTEIKVAEPKKPTIPKEPVTVGDKQYMWNVPTVRGRGGVILSAQEASNDEEFMAALVAVEGQGLLRELV